MIRRLVVVFALLSIVPVGVAPATTIDSFDTGTQLLRVSKNRINDSGQAATSAALGGYRDVSLQWVSGAGANYGEIAAESNGVLCFTQGGEAKAKLTWDGTDSPNTLDYGLASDLTSGDQTGFVLGIESVTNAGMAINLTIFTDATHASTYSLVAGASESPVALFLPYSEFTTLGSAGNADFSHVGAIVLGLDGSGRSGSDITIASITTSATAPLPEPAGLAMIATCLAGLLVYAWRQYA